MSVNYNNIWTVDPYVYKATSSGVQVYTLASESLLSFIAFPGVSSVWADDQNLYVGTTISGIYSCLVSTISGSPVLVPYKSYPDILNNHVNYIHGAGNYLCVTSISGINRYNITTSAHRDNTPIENPNKCFQLDSGDYYYYTTVSSGGSKLYANYEGVGSYEYPVGDGEFINASQINDIHVTQDTSIYGGNVLFLATTHGAHVIEEKRNDELNCRRAIYLIK